MKATPVLRCCRQTRGSLTARRYWIDRSINRCPRRSLSVPRYVRARPRTARPLSLHVANGFPRGLAACAILSTLLPRLAACAILSTLLACLGALAYIEPRADRWRRRQAAVVTRLLFAAADETEHALAVSAAELHRALHASREHARELLVARRAASSLVELERRQVTLVAAAERDGFRASGLAKRAAESEESASWASRAMEAASSDGAHLETEVRLAIAAARRAAMFERDAAVEALGEARHAAQEVGHLILLTQASHQP